MSTTITTHDTTRPLEQLFETIDRRASDLVWVEDKNGTLYALAIDEQSVSRQLTDRVETAVTVDLHEETITEIDPETVPDPDALTLVQDVLSSPRRGD